METFLRFVRRGLDGLYLLGGLVAALFLIAILIIILAQMVARWSGIVFTGSTNYAGYCMAAASFFALAYALNRGAHIRVNLLLNRLGSLRRFGEIWCFAIGTFLSGYFCWFAWKAVGVSRMLNDISQGQDATPLWVPQIAMGLGTTLLFIAFLDNFMQVLFTGRTGIRAETVDQSHGE